jgi:hypothetical protein
MQIVFDRNPQRWKSEIEILPDGSDSVNEKPKHILTILKLNFKSKAKRKALCTNPRVALKGESW